MLYLESLGIPSLLSSTDIYALPGITQNPVTQTSMLYLESLRIPSLRHLCSTWNHSESRHSDIYALPGITLNPVTQTSMLYLESLRIPSLRHLCSTWNHSESPSLRHLCSTWNHSESRHSDIYALPGITLNPVTLEQHRHPCPTGNPSDLRKKAVRSLL